MVANELRRGPAVDQGWQLLRIAFQPAWMANHDREPGNKMVVALVPSRIDGTGLWGDSYGESVG
jgi:hypothetical protein